MDKYAGFVSNFVLALLHCGTNAHLMHWTTSSFSKHMALGTFYDLIVDQTDAYAEAYMGKYGQLKKFPNEYHPPNNDPIKYFEVLSKFVMDIRKELPQDSELNQLVDNIQENIDSTLYKLKYLD
jgi:hypothetical protein